MGVCAHTHTTPPHALPHTSTTGVFNNLHHSDMYAFMPTYCLLMAFSSHSTRFLASWHTAATESDRSTFRIRGCGFTTGCRGTAAATPDFSTNAVERKDEVRALLDCDPVVACSDEEPSNASEANLAGDSPELFDMAVDELGSVLLDCCCTGAPANAAGPGLPGRRPVTAAATMLTLAAEPVAVVPLRLDFLEAFFRNTKPSTLVRTMFKRNRCGTRVAGRLGRVNSSKFSTVYWSRVRRFGGVKLVHLKYGVVVSRDPEVKKSKKSSF